MANPFILILSLLSVLSVLWHGNILSLFASAVTVLLMASLLAEIHLSVWGGTVLAAANFLFSPLLSSVRAFQYFKKPSNSGARMTLQWLIPITVISLFTILYYNASPVFANLLDQLAWPDIPELIGITLMGIICITTVFSSYCPPSLSRFLKRDTMLEFPGFRDNHLKAWRFTVWLLAGLLAFVVLTDAYYRLMAQTLPPGLTYSEYLHQGVFSLIFSVVLAAFLSISVATFHSYEKDKTMRSGLYTFLIVNGLYVIQTAMRNAAYIDQYGLTEKRVAVYVYLFLGLSIILITAFAMFKSFKVLFVYKKIGLMAVSTLVLCAFVNWSNTITSYNLSHRSKVNDVDYSYLLSLNDCNLPQLVPHQTAMSVDEAQRLNNKMHWYKESKTSSNSDLRSFVLDSYLLKKRLNTYLNQKPEIIK